MRILWPLASTTAHGESGVSLPFTRSLCIRCIIQSKLDPSPPVGQHPSLSRSPTPKVGHSTLKFPHFSFLSSHSSIPNPPSPSPPCTNPARPPPAGNPKLWQAQRPTASPARLNPTSMRNRYPPAPPFRAPPPPLPPRLRHRCPLRDVPHPPACSLRSGRAGRGSAERFTPPGPALPPLSRLRGAPLAAVAPAFRSFRLRLPSRFRWTPGVHPTLCGSVSQGADSSAWAGRGGRLEVSFPIAVASRPPPPAHGASWGCDVRLQPVHSPWGRPGSSGRGGRLDVSPQQDVASRPPPPTKPG